MPLICMCIHCRLRLELCHTSFHRFQQHVHSLCKFCAVDLLYLLCWPSPVGLLLWRPIRLSLSRCRIGHSVHYTVLDRSLNGHEDPHALVGTDPAPTPWFTPQMLAKVHTLIPLIWRCAFH